MNLEKRKQLIGYMKKVAQEAAGKQTKSIRFEELLDSDDEGKRILYVIPESFGDIFMCTSLFKSIKEQYPWANLYVAVKTQYMEVLEGNPYIHKVIQYVPQMDNQVYLEGAGSHKGFFELSFHPYICTQRFLNYLNNGKTNLAVELK